MRPKKRRKTFASQLTSMEDQIQDIKNQIERLDGRHENVKELIEQTSEGMSTDIEIKELEVKNMDTQRARGKTDILSANRDELEKLLFEMQDRETKVKKLSKQINETEKSIASKRLN